VRTIAFISDVHCGTMYSIMPENFQLKEGNPLPLNDGQKLILEYWEKFWQECESEGVDTNVWCSDLIHGQNPIERGTQLLTTDFNEQIRMFLELAKSKAMGRKNHFVSGSGYHRGVRGGSPDQVICSIINEMDNTELDSRFLQSLGQQIGARYFDIDSVDESITELFKATRRVGSSTYMTSVWPRWWLLGLSCLLLSICWFVRRAIGLV